MDRAPMHIADYTKIFARPDELADFLMLEVKEQDRFLGELAKSGGLGGVEVWCRLRNEQPGGAKE